MTGVTPLPQTSRSGGSAGIFIGVNEFELDRSLSPLRYAVNDAVAQAHLFVEELHLIPAGNCILLLSGEPSTDLARIKLDELKALGINPQRASRTAIFQALLLATGRPMAAEDLLVLSFSTHGFEDRGIGYVMPTDGSRALLSDSGISVLTIQERLAGSGSGKKLLLVDACRELVEKGGKGGPSVMSDGFADAFTKARGMSVLHSCSRGQYSLERDEIGHGVFTYHLLKALGGEAAADHHGYITLGSVADYLKSAVPEWVQSTNPSISRDKVQEPAFREENGDARSIPLAVSRAGAEQQEKLRERRNAALQRIFAVRQNNPHLVSRAQQVEIEDAVESWEADRLDELLMVIEDVDPTNPLRVKLLIAWWTQQRAQPPRSASRTPDTYRTEAQLASKAAGPGPVAPHDASTSPALKKVAWRSDYPSMAVAGTFNGWDGASKNMKLVAHNTWLHVATLQDEVGAEFKFVTDGTWTADWGQNNQDKFSPPMDGTADAFGPHLGKSLNIRVDSIESGTYRFMFNDRNRKYSVEKLEPADLNNNSIHDVQELFDKMPANTE